MLRKDCWRDILFLLIWNFSNSKNKGIELLGLFMSVCSCHLLLFMSSSCSVFPSSVGRVAVLCSGHGIVQSLPKAPFYNSVPWTGVLTVRTYTSEHLFPLRIGISIIYRLYWANESSQPLGPFKDYPQVTVYHPSDPKYGHAFANFGWTAWFGSITGFTWF